MSNNINAKLRIELVQKLMSEHGIDVSIVTPGINFRYLTNENAISLERLTALVIGKDNYWLVVPQLEFHQAQELHSDLEIIPWRETDDPYSLVADLVRNPEIMALDEKMPYFHVEKFQKKICASFLSFASISQQLRSVKSESEILELKKIGESINKVHLQLTNLRFKNKSEIQVAKEIRELILVDHETVDFVIVAAGPNSANPHHIPGERLIKSGDVVVIDIGGTSRSGYCSDCTRTYVVDQTTEEFSRDFSQLLNAQALGVSEAKAGIPAESLDNFVREYLEKADLAQWFIHRLGHGIGMETHEAPYLVAGNEKLLEFGNVFSIEPGFYIPGKWGARIEDIVAVTELGLINFNDFDHGLRILS